MTNASAATIKNASGVDYIRLLARIQKESGLRSILPEEKEDDLHYYLKAAIGCLGNESAVILKQVYSDQQPLSLTAVAGGYGISVKAASSMERAALQKLVHRVHFIRYGTWREDAPLVAGKH